MIYREQYYIHRCPRCNSDSIQTNIKEKSGSITSFLSDLFIDNQNGFVCTKCGYIWKKANIKDETPIHILEQIKEEEVNKRRSKLLRLFIWAAMCFLIGLLCYLNSTAGIIKVLFYGYIIFLCFLAEISLIIHIVRTWNDLNYYKSLHPEYFRIKS